MYKNFSWKLHDGWLNIWAYYTRAGDKWPCMQYAWVYLTFPWPNCVKWGVKTLETIITCIVHSCVYILIYKYEERGKNACGRFRVYKDTPPSRITATYPTYSQRKRDLIQPLKSPDQTSDTPQEISISNASEIVTWILHPPVCRQ